MKNRLFLCAMLMLISCFTGAAQQAQQPQQPLTFWYEYHVNPGKEDEFLNLVKTVGAPVRDKLMAEGVVQAWGVESPIIRVPESATHLIWFTVADYAGLEKVQTAMQEQIANASRYREMIARTGRFLTFCGGAPTIGARMRADPSERTALKLVRETDAGIVVRGKIGMHTSPAFAEDVYVGSLSGIDIGEHRATFIVPVNAPGVTTVCRKMAVRDANAFVAPLSSRYDELDGQMWLDDVFIPWEHVFLLGESPEPVVRWLIWHHLYGWLSKAEFTLGLALALTHAMGLIKHDQTIEHLVDLAIEVQTVRSCLVATERDPRFTAEGYCVPNHAHLAVGGIAILKARQRMAEILRIVPGSSLVVAPSDRDLDAPEVAAGLAESFGGGGYTARQRSALLQMAWDHVSSALDGRESAFELHASGGIPAWRGRLRRNFERYNELANAVVRRLDLPMPEIDLDSIREVPWAPRRTVTAPGGGAR